MGVWSILLIVKEFFYLEDFFKREKRGKFMGWRTGEEGKKREFGRVHGEETINSSGSPKFQKFTENSKLSKSKKSNNEKMN